MLQIKSQITSMHCFIFYSSSSCQGREVEGAILRLELADNRCIPHIACIVTLHRVVVMEVNDIHRTTSNRKPSTATTQIQECLFLTSLFLF